MSNKPWKTFQFTARPLDDAEYIQPGDFSSLNDGASLASIQEIWVDKRAREFIKNGRTIWRTIGSVTETSEIYPEIRIVKVN